MIASHPEPQASRLAPLGHFDESDAAASLIAGWALLHEAGAAVAAMAQLGEERCVLASRDFAMRAAAAGPARLLLAEQMIDDCAAALHAGLTALMDSQFKLGADASVAVATLGAGLEGDVLSGGDLDYAMEGVSNKT